MKHILKKMYKTYSLFISESELMKKIIYLQHKLLPLPLRAFDKIFSNPLLAKLLAPYGMHVFMADYEKTTKYQSYWESKQSLYWHLYRQTHVSKNLVNLIQQETDLAICLKEKELSILEIGFGLGKTTKMLLENGVIRHSHLFATDTNPFLCNYVKRHNSFFKGEVKCINVSEILKTSLTFDLLMAHGGVLMYLAPEEVEELFKSLSHRGCKLVIITDEGFKGKDYYRPDGAVMYDFKTRLMKAGFDHGYVFIEKEGPHSLHELFAMYPKS